MAHDYVFDGIAPLYIFAISVAATFHISYHLFLFLCY